MTTRHFIQLAYNGAPFHGWQTQPGGMPTVQATLEQALATVLRSPHPIPVTGAGRTDTGVNASMMIAHFDWYLPIEGHRLARSLNSLLAPNIAVYAITPVHQEAHARFDATSRTYHYYAHTYPSPFLRQFSWQAPPTLDFEAMNQAARLLLDVIDFTSFAKLHSNARTNICHVTKAEWQQLAPGQWRFTITADRFLRNMVRAVVGTLVDVGRHKITPSQVLDIIARRDRCAAGTSMPPHPLFLSSITYPYYTPVTP